MIKQLSEVCPPIEAGILKAIMKKVKKNEQSVVKGFCKCSTAHRQKATVKVNVAESEQNLFAYENSWALMALD